MANVRIRDTDGTTHLIELEEGQSVMKAARTNGLVGIIGECGGMMNCATCHVYVEPEQDDLLPEMSDQEDAMLEGTAAERKPNSRLSCQLRFSCEATIDLVVADRQY